MSLSPRMNIVILLVNEKYNLERRWCTEKKSVNSFRNKKDTDQKYRTNSLLPMMFPPSRTAALDVSGPYTC